MAGENNDPRHHIMSDSRTRAIAVLVFEFGGVAGAVRRIVFGWHGADQYRAGSPLAAPGAKQTPGRGLHQPHGKTARHRMCRAQAVKNLPTYNLCPR
jgi:hypothetical protein